ncbi:PilZ domain-containing protein [Marinobacter sp. ATCH36]|uniref:PilZ domain-containing protein n=1 Tax=Marinobacter sp. ATCH36 TaxID=2945106 RepID=UPI0020226D7F|nr:PilZ domain-containing protein [Marinobacter sp. ATCH36]MCL7945787.1 PilZ domain-containing protein [Marinobacter sp. ATCH36]
MAATTPHNDPTDIPSDRRDFFRISDHIGLEIRKLGSDDGERENPFNGSHLEDLRSEFRRLDQDVRAQLATLAERDRLLTSLLKSLNGKLDTLARIMAFEQNPLQPEDWQDVTLSEGGLSFHTATNSFMIDQVLALRMTLPPELFQPVAVARIINIEPDGSGGARVHTEFTDIHDSDRQQIARHVMRWQIRQRQKE